MTNEIINIRSVTKRFPGVTALEGVTLDVRAGELHAICGENGAGKSTLMKILSGVITDYEGELLLAGKPVRFKGTRDAEAAGISIIHQELILVEDFAYADGEKDRKTWHLQRQGPGVFTGTREDVIGTARVWTEDKRVRLQYAVKLGGWTVDFSDMLALRPDGTLLNRATVSKWGIGLGRVELVLHRVSPRE